MEHAAESVASSYVKAGDLVRSCQRHGQWLERAGVGDAFMRPVPVVEVLELPHGMQEVGLVPDKVRFSSSRRQVCTHRSMIEFILGIRTPLSTVSMPTSARMASNGPGNFPSRSLTRNRAR